MIDQLQVLHVSLHDKNQKQEDAMSNRLLHTKNRVEALNAVWEFMEKISNASKIIYAENPTKTEQYLLYPEGITNSGVIVGNARVGDPRVSHGFIARPE